MATGISLSAADKALHTSSEKANFQRLARLLMCGGLILLREVFDSIHSPANLPAVLSHPATVRLLNGARLTRAERDRLYPPSGGYGTSRDFDTTLLFRLLRAICNLTPPLTGWDCLPPSTDLSCEADLVRIKFYRNAIYGHNQTMEISDDEFVDLWREISEALLRIARSFSSAKRDEWKDSIDKFLHDPLTPDAERSVEELQSWYKRDMDTKDEVERLRNEVEQLNIKQEQMNIKQEQMNIEQEQMSIMLRQLIDIHINVESLKAGGSSISPAQPINTLGLQDTGLQHVCIPITPDQSQEEGAVGESTREMQSNQQCLPALIPTIWNVILSCKNSLNNVVGYLSNLGVYVQGNRLGSLVITVSCSSLQVLERLWEDYCSGHLNKVVQQTLVTAEVLEELGLSEVKLKTTISEEEYKACEGFFMQSSGKIYSVVGSSDINIL